MVVDKPVRVIRNKAIPARIGFEINLDNMCARASCPCSSGSRPRTWLLLTHPLVTLAGVVALNPLDEGSELRW
jgi:hypothetical protein